MTGGSTDIAQCPVAARHETAYAVFSGIGCRESGSRTPVDQISPVRQVADNVRRRSGYPLRSRRHVPGITL
jgi:hypothetical protein